MGLANELSRRWPRVAVTIRRELADWRVWATRAIVVAGAAVAGLVVVAFTRLSEFAFGWFHTLEEAHWWSPLLWTPACTALIVWLTTRFAPGAAGSGIPQVMAALEPEEPSSGFQGLRVFPPNQISPYASAPSIVG